MIHKKDEKSIAVAVKQSLEFLTGFEVHRTNYPDMPLDLFFNRFLEGIGWDQPENPMPLINQGSLLAHLYGLIVYPWEALQDGFPVGKTVNELDPNEWGTYSIIHLAPGYDPNNLDLRFFLKKIRNAISHATVDILDDMSFVFKDMRVPNRAATIKFEINDLMTFVLRLYSSYLDDWNFDN